MYHYYLRYKQQKNRGFIAWKRPQLLFGNSGLACLSSGFISSNSLKRFCIVFKKRLKTRKNMTRYWVRLCYNYIFTKKGANTRMGKGKGSIKSYGCYYHSGNSLVEFFNIRNGLLQKLLQFIRVRCAFRVGSIHYKHGSVNSGKLFFKNAAITRYFFRKKKTFPTLKKNFKFITFKLLLDNRFFDTRRVRSVFRKVNLVHVYKRKSRFLGKSWLNCFIFGRHKRYSRLFTAKTYKFFKIPYFKVLRLMRRRRLRTSNFYSSFFKKFFFVDAARKLLKLMFFTRSTLKFFGARLLSVGRLYIRRLCKNIVRLRKKVRRRRSIMPKGHRPLTRRFINRAFRARRFFMYVLRTYKNKRIKLNNFKKKLIFLKKKIKIIVS